MSKRGSSHEKSKFPSDLSAKGTSMYPGEKPGTGLSGKGASPGSDLKPAGSGQATSQPHRSSAK